MKNVARIKLSFNENTKQINIVLKNTSSVLYFLVVVVGGLLAKLCWTLAPPWTVAHQAPLSMEFSRQEYWSGLPFSSPGDLSDPGIEPGSPALQADFYQLSYVIMPVFLAPHYLTLHGLICYPRTPLRLPCNLWGQTIPLASFANTHSCFITGLLTSSIIKILQSSYLSLTSSDFLTTI